MFQSRFSLHLLHQFSVFSSNSCLLPVPLLWVLKMAVICNMISISLIEKDTNDDILWTWTYPSVTSDQRVLLLHKCGLENRPLLFRYYHQQHSWYYLYFTELLESSQLSKVKQFVLVLQTREFNPERYEQLAKILSKAYCRSGDPTSLLHLYLSAAIGGSCTTEENGTFLVGEYSQLKAFAASPVKEVIRTFGLESILIYTALMLKKRIVVYHHRLDKLLSMIRALPALIWHRQNWDFLYPYVELSEQELDELRGLPFYAAGFCDAGVEGRIDLYDLFVNLAAMEITVPAHSRESFAMTKTHKEIAVLMVRQSESDESTDQDVIQELASKTRELLHNLHSLSSANKEGRLVLTLEELKAKKFSLSLENFLWNLAAAESLLQM